MPRLIDADALLNRSIRIEGSFSLTNGRVQPFEAISVRDIETAPTIDAVPVVRGYWEGYSTNSFGGYDEDRNPKWIDKKFYRCSECRKGTVIKSKYCPYCGANMAEV